MVRGWLDGWLPEQDVSMAETGNEGSVLVSERNDGDYDVAYEQALARFAKLYVAEFTGVRVPNTTTPVEEGWG